MRRLLLLPLLAPLLAVCLTGALNLRPSVSLRLLVWQSPALPLGAWLAAAAAAGAALSGGAAALALREPSPSLRRQVRRSSAPHGDTPWEDGDGGRNDDLRAGWRGLRRERRQEPPDRSRSAPRWQGPERQKEPGGAWAPAAGVSAGPARQPGAPPPTVAVPYRVLRRREAMAEPTPEAMRAPIDATRRERTREPVPAADDWGESSVEDW